MNRGFVTSALLYGILSLFLVLVLSTVATIGNRKLAIDRIKQSALEDVQELTTPDNCFMISPIETIDGVKRCAITNYTYNVNKKCSANVFIPKTIGLGSKKCNVYAIKSGAFENQTNVATVTISENIENIEDEAFNGCNNITFIIKGAIRLMNPSTDNIVEEGEQNTKLWGAMGAYVKQG